MRKWLVFLALVAAAAGVLTAHQVRAVPSASACSDWGNTTAKRVDQARLLVYPSERGGKTTGSPQSDAQFLVKLAQDQANSKPPSSGAKLSGDLVEAFSAAANAIAGTGNAARDAQMAFAKAIIYNADLRIAYLLDHC